MSLDGLRAWIGEVEHKLGVRTRVFLILVAIAVGGAAAGIYVGVEARNDQVSEGDLQAVREELKGRIGGGGGATDLTQVEAELSALRAEVAQLREAGSTEEKGSSTGATGGEEAETASPGDASTTPGNASTNSGNAIGKLQRLREKTEAQAGK